MFRPHIGDCSNPECNRAGVPIVVKDGFCDKCHHERKQAKKKAKGKKTTGYRYVKESTGEKSVFESILEDLGDSPARCWVCDERITLIMPHNFAHILPKKGYEEYRLYKPNIKLMCFKVIADMSRKEDNLHPQGCHYAADFVPESELKKNPIWNKFFEEKERLKQLYPNKI